MVKNIKVICSLELLLQQMGGQCKHDGCIHDAAKWNTSCVVPLQ